MNPEFTSIGLTIAAGALSVLTVFAVLWALRPDLPLRLPLTAKEDATFLGAAVGLALVLALGLIVENLSKSIVGNPPPFSAQVWKPISWVLPTDRQLRSDQVIRVDGNQWKLVRIGKGLARSGAFAMHAPNDIGTSMDQSVHSPDHARSVSITQAMRAAEQVYYAAKNTLYQDDNYFIELRAIEHRVAFARSLCFVSILGVLASLGCYLRRLLRHDTLERHIRRASRYKLVMLTLAFVTATAAGRAVYLAEQFNYNVRIYGYYETMLAMSALEP